MPTKLFVIPFIDTNSNYIYYKCRVFLSSQFNVPWAPPMNPIYLCTSVATTRLLTDMIWWLVATHKILARTNGPVSTFQLCCDQIDAHHHLCSVLGQYIFPNYISVLVIITSDGPLTSILIVVLIIRDLWYHTITVPSYISVLVSIL